MSELPPRAWIDLVIFLPCVFVNQAGSWRGEMRSTARGWQGIFHDIWRGKWVMLGVAALLASSSMAAIELITLYARLDNALHKMATPLLLFLLLLLLFASHLSLHLLSARHRKDLSIALEELESKVPLFFPVSLFMYPNNEGMLLLCGATGV